MNADSIPPAKAAGVGRRAGNPGGSFLTKAADTLLFALIMPPILAYTLISCGWRRCTSETDIAMGTDFTRSSRRILGDVVPYTSMARIRRIGAAKTSHIPTTPRFRAGNLKLCEQVEHPDFRGYWVIRRPFQPAAGTPIVRDITLLWIHGGAYCFGDACSPTVQMLRIAEIAAAYGVTLSVFSLDYTLVPDAQFPTQQRESVAAYRYLLDSNVTPEDLCIVGESAGGHLAIACLLGISQSNLPTPHGAMLMYPWVNLANSGATFISNKYKDVLNKGMLDFCVSLALGKNGRQSCAKLVNFADSAVQRHWGNVMPACTRVNVGTHDLFLDDIERWVEQASQDGANVTMETQRGMCHGWQIHADEQVEKQYLESTPETDVEMPGSRSIARDILRIFALDVDQARSP